MVENLSTTNMHFDSHYLCFIFKFSYSNLDYLITNSKNSNSKKVNFREWLKHQFNKFLLQRRRFKNNLGKKESDKILSSTMLHVNSQDLQSKTYRAVNDAIDKTYRDDINNCFVDCESKNCMRNCLRLAK
nr:uncharacterized protein LOC124812699 [Hydra vulgaris]